MGGKCLGRDTRASVPNRAPNGRKKRAEKEGAKVEETVKEDRVEGPMEEETSGTTDEQGRLKMRPVRACATQPDEEPSSSANANLQLSETQPPLAQAEVPSPPPRPPPARPMVPLRILLHLDTNFHTAQPLV